MAWYRLVALGTVCFMTISWAGTPVCERSTRSDDERLTALMAVQNEFDYATGDFNLLRESVLKRFGELWCDAEYGRALAEASAPNVAIRLRAATNVTFYAQTDWALERHRSVLAEAHERGLAEGGAYRSLFSAYQAAGRYDEAEALREAFPQAGLPEPPEVRQPQTTQPEGSRLVWRVDGDSNRLEGEWLSLDEAQLLVVTSPGCGYCRAAVQRLQDDEILGPLVRQHSAWLAERSLNNTFQSVAQWNAHYPDVPTLFVDEPDDWPIPAFSATPRFHFVQDGTILHTLVGWQGGSDALIAIADGFSRLGLLDAARFSDGAFAYADVEDSPSPVRGCPAREEARERIRSRAPIRTRAELDDHLRALEAGANSPLKLFSAEGRKRFVAEFRFHPDGQLLGFGYGELRAQLEPKEIYEVTALFGEQYVYAGRLFEDDLLSEEEQRLKAMLHCET